MAVDYGMVGDDGASFDSFFRAESDPLLKFCWGLTLEKEAARDVAQEVMTRAWKNWNQISRRTGERETNPAAWCRTVALNLVRGEWRRERVVAASASERPSPEVNQPVDIDLVNALRRLAERQREAVVFHHLMDMSVGACALEMQVSVATVKTHLQRARAELALLLNEDTSADESENARTNAREAK